MMDSRAVGAVHYDSQRQKSYLMTAQGVRVIDQAVAQAIKTGYLTLDRWYRQTLYRRLVTILLAVVLTNVVQLVIWWRVSK
jgi:hypothetical protein